MKAVILVLSNSDLKNAKDIKYDMDSEGSCGKLTGYTKITSSMNTPFANTRTEYVMEDVLVYNGEEEAYVIKERVFRYIGETSGGTDVIVGSTGNEMQLGTMGKHVDGERFSDAKL